MSLCQAEEASCRRCLGKIATLPKAADEEMVGIDQQRPLARLVLPPSSRPLPFTATVIPTLPASR